MCGDRNIHVCQQSVVWSEKFNGKSPKNLAKIDTAGNDTVDDEIKIEEHDARDNPSYSEPFPIPPVHC